MLAGPLPKQLNFGNLVNSGTIVGTVPAAGFERLAEVVDTVNGDVAVEVRFSQTALTEDVILDGDASVGLKVACQTCLELMDLTVNCSFSTRLVPSEQALLDLDAEDDGVVVEYPYIAIGDFLEDELLLAIPMVPRHAESCTDDDFVASESEVDEEQETHRPFATLAKMMKDQNLE